MSLRPFFPFYGSKWRDAVKHYPAPVHDTIVEPFAGSAGYSLRHPGRRVVLCDTDEVIIAVWEYLLKVSSAEILAIPDVPAGGCVADLRLTQEAAWLVGFWCARGRQHPALRPSAWMRQGDWALSFWGERVRQTIAGQLDAIRHWRVHLCDYSACPVDGEATWFVDPPYRVAGRRYRHGSAGIEYDHLGYWCRGRRGQVIVCENSGATWLPFRDVGVVSTLRKNMPSAEAVWTNTGEDAGEERGMLTNSKSFTFRRYIVKGDVDRDALIANMQEDSFLENLHSRSQEDNTGWCTVNDPADVNLELSKVSFGNYVVAGYRVDRKRLPGKLFKSLLERRYREVMAERGVERLGRNHKLEIKEALAEELLGKQLPAIAVHDAAVDLERSIAWVFTASETAADAVVGAMLHAMPGCELAREGALEWLAATEGGRGLLSQWHGEPYDLDAGDDPLTEREGGHVLGAEFLAWLWMCVDLRAGEFVLDCGDVELWIEDRLTLADVRSNERRPARAAFANGAPSVDVAARESAREGRLPVELRLGMRRGEAEWLFTLRADGAGVCVRGAKLPCVVKDGLEEVVYERMFLLEQLQEVVAQLYVRFFAARIADEWDGELREWLKGGETAQ